MPNASRRRAGFPCISLLAAGLLAAAHSHAQPADDASGPGATELDAVLVVAQRAQRVSSGATGLDLDIKATPQSISVVSREQMEQFGADTINDALRLATGISVEEWETNRTNYAARGFEIKNNQIDGVGLPNDWGIVTGALDSYGYEELEVIRGANGLLTGVGNAAGTVNYVRKRPTNEGQGGVGISAGSWDNRRIQGDYSSPVTDDGRWAARIVAAHEEGGSHLRDFANDRSFLYGVVDGQVGERGTLALGYAWQANRTDGNMWGALTLVNNDGTQAEFDTSASTTQDWTYWNTTTQNGFAEYTHELSPDWRLKASYNYRRSGNDDQLFFAYSSTGLDPQTGEGLYGWPGKYVDETTAHLGDVSVGGRYTLFGREHEAILGASVARSEQTYWNHAPDSGFDALPGFPYAGNAVPEPDWGPKTFYSVLDQRLKRVYGVARLALTDRFKAVVGFNFAEYHRDGDNSGVLFDQTERETSPYGGLTYDFTDSLLGYVSYSDIYQPQDQYDIDRNYLDPSKGVNYEVGVKKDWLGKRLLTTLAWFRAEQEGLSTYAGVTGDLQYYYTGIDVESEGFEFEAVGRLGDHVSAVLGYTTLELTGPDGEDVYEWYPRHTANLQVAAKLPSYPALAFGLGGRWQSRTSGLDSYTGYTVRQAAYAVLNAFVAWDFVPNATLRLNANNLADEKYVTSLYQVGYYGAPRNYSLSLDWRF
ncbi:ferric-rhodotorulic acid/ferric-coprogen receptor FhuE [Pseudoxanthomonas sangjuensis]|uniref:TonB-dependent siderophore receptor n=1 Tax=Pseudoxanthomonas sangjuensis TaxID=1503750 RepID=UPI00139203E4|nr:TonB-dependent siderophore receptor [Pseudoxanthomonas sangjuensis]KAF1715145.1 TonB-dependent siderophore receptor [Pseudoxanthomonas sangjuensis]